MNILVAGVAFPAQQWRHELRTMQNELRTA
jgi:hypothetical protein